VIPRELPDLRCSPSKQEVLEALWRAWWAMFDTEPTREQLCVLLAQQTQECGWPGQGGLHCWNFGNEKHARGDGRCWVYFTCDEIIDGRSVVFNAPPPHDPLAEEIPGFGACCFRAYLTIDEGAADHLGMLAKRFATAWHDVLEGDPAGFSRRLKVMHYYTADEAIYTRGVVSLFHQFTTAKFDWSFADRSSAPPAPEVQQLVQLIDAPTLLANARAGMKTERDQTEKGLHD